LSRSGSLDAEVIVVGAGFARLSAAAELDAAGVSCLIVEANDRVGGRVEARPNPLGELTDTGGQYVCEGMDEVIALARALGKTFVDGLHDGDMVLSPPLASTGDELYAAIMSIRARERSLDPADPAIAGLSVAAWARMQPEGEPAISAYLSAMEGLWCQPTDELPLWYLVSNDRRITNKVPELQYFLSETMQSLADDLARPLGDRLSLGERAVGIAVGGGVARLRTDRRELAARHVVLAIPPAQAAGLYFKPGLPADLARTLPAWRPGRVVKVQLRYAEAFWRRQGRSGSVYFLDPLGLYICDASASDDRPALVAFAGGAMLADWRRGGEAGFLERLRAKLGATLGPEAASPIAVLARDWTGDPFCGGAYSDSVIDLAARDAEDALRRGMPGVSFASSELSPSYPGYIEGAIIAGRAGAAQAIAALAPSDQSASATSASGS